MTEKEWQAQVVKLLRLAGWRTYHTFDSRRSDPGFPDLIAVRENRVLAIELKVGRHRATDAQVEWLLALEGVKVVDAFVLRESGELATLEELVS